MKEEDDKVAVDPLTDDEDFEDDSEDEGDDAKAK